MVMRMNNEGLPSERRRHERFQVKNPAFVFDSFRVGKIVNLSMDGLAFTYDGREHWPQGIAALDLLIDEEIFLNRLPVRVVSDLIIAEESRYQMVTRQCGVQFGRLSSSQLHQLEYFIRIHIQEVSIALTVETLMGSLGYD
jgi:hypothetical protein